MIDERTAAFLELVDCKPHEVRDIPRDRRGVDPLSRANNWHPLSSKRRAKLKIKKKRGRVRQTLQDDYWTNKPTKVWRPRHP